jgi:hypothetical protein
MGRPLKVIRPVKKSICLPETLVAKVDLLLWSALEACIPRGAWQNYIVALIEADMQARAQQPTATKELKGCNDYN